MSFFIEWCCAHCQKKERLDVAAGDVREKSAYEMPLPAGWAWHKYTSARLPNVDTRTLGCSPEHAKLASASFALPFED